jgi:pilus assembly protein Flp/PilA
MNPLGGLPGHEAEVLRPGRVPRGEPAKETCTGELHMKTICNTLVKVIKDEQGGEVLEYALIAGLIVVAAIAVIGSVGTKVLARWGSLNSSM